MKPRWPEALMLAMVGFCVFLLATLPWWIEVLHAH